MKHKRSRKRPGDVVARLVAASAIVLTSLGLAIFGNVIPASPVFAQGNSPATECAGYEYYWKFDNFDESTGSYGNIEENAPDGVTLTLTPTNWKEEDGKKEALEFNWTSNVYIDKMIVKAGNAANDNIYTFPSPGATSGHGVSNDNKGISHVTFCWNGDDGPTPPDPGTITIKKLVVNAPDGDTTQFEFNPSWSGSSISLGANETQSSGDLEAGIYSVSEINIPANWSLTNSTCDDGSTPGQIDLAENEDITCTFTNTYTAPALDPLVVTKTVNATGQIEYDWTITKSAEPTSLNLDEGESDDIEYNINVTRSIKEQTYSATGTVTITNNNDVAVSVTAISDIITQGNDDITATFTECLTLPFDIGANSAVECDYSATLTSSASGTNNVAVTTADNVADGSGSQDFTVNVTELYATAQVSDTNTAFQGPKTVTGNDDFTYKVSFDCSMIEGEYGDDHTKSDSFDNTATVFNGDKTFDDDTATVDLTCTNPPPDTGTIVIVKDTMDFSPADDAIFSFDPSWDASNFNLATDPETTYPASQSFVLEAGSYTVAELSATPEGTYELVDIQCAVDGDNGSSGSGSVDTATASIDLEANDTVTCTFYNETKRGSITVVKQTDPDGSDVTFNFDLVGVTDASIHEDIDGIGDGESHTVNDLKPYSTYNITEVVPVDWDLTTVECVSTQNSNKSAITNGYSLFVAPDENWTCTFTNTEKQPELTPLAVSKTVEATGTLEYGWTIDKTANPTSLALEEGDSSGVLYTLDVTRTLVSETYSATGTITIKNNNQEAVSITAINDVITQGQTETTATLTDCDTPFSLDAGAEITCHYQATLPNSAAGSNSVSVVTDTEAGVANGSATQSFNVEVTKVNETAQVTDTNTAFEGPKTVFDSDQFTYTVSFDCSMIEGDYGDDNTKTDSFDNTANVGDGQTVFDQDTATVDLTCTNPPPGIQIVKTADPLQVTAPGGDVTFSFQITNTATDEAVTITSLTDDVFGDLTLLGDCQLVGTTIQVGNSVSCSFTQAVNGDAGDTHHNTVTVVGVDDDNTQVSDEDDATVNIVAPPETPSIQIIKSVEPTTVVEPGEDVTFTFTITNTSPTLPVTITSLTDDVFGDLTLLGNCQLVGQTLIAGQSAFCSFIAPISGNAGDTHKNTVIVTGEDPDGTPVSDQDDATVEIIAASEQPAIRVIKTADPTQISSVGENVTYTFTVTNPTANRTIVVDELDDSLYGQLGENPDGLISNDCALPQTLGPGGDYTCQITVFIDGEVGDKIVNVVTVRGHDQETNKPVSDDDDATVTIVAEPPVVIPEAPMAVLFPLVGLLMAAGTWLVLRRRRWHTAE